MDFRFSSEVAELAFLSDRRILDWVAGYNSSKTWTAIQKSLYLAQTFSGYRIGVFRSNATDLKRTTKQTFYKVCPEELIEHEVEAPVPETTLKNGSKYYWLHVDHTNINSIKSLELNMAIYDQAEDLKESVFDAIDSRVGRWEQVKIPPELIPYLPKNEFTGRPEPPAYFILLLNPPDEGEIHFCYSTLEPKSDYQVVSQGPFHLIKQNKRVTFIESSSVLNQAINKENLDTLLARDPEYVERFVHGKRTQGAGSIHNIRPDSFIDYDPEFIKRLISKSALTRILDFGSTAPTCCTWWAAYKGIHVCYREYYVPDKVISYHRREIGRLSEGEYYIGNYADPSIFRKDREKNGGRYSVGDEFGDASMYSLKPGDAPPIYWSPADNNEFATRNRINELLIPSERNVHPITGRSPAPSIYFIKKSIDWPNGCDFVIKETISQKKMLLDTINGKPIYSEDRDDSIADHGYDNLRYYVSIHQNPMSEVRPKADKRSFKEVLRRLKAQKIYGERIYGT